MRAVKRRVSILGATGSVGANTIELIELAGFDRYEVVAVTANRDASGLADVARRVGARIAVVADDSCHGDLKTALDGSGIEAAAGARALVDAASEPVDWVMAAIVGTAGLAPTLAAIRQGATVALANKECLVCAGDFVLREAAAAGATLLPADSEHNAIFQVLDRDRPETVDRLILTASGGPFRTASRTRMMSVTPAEAVAHPNWVMGAKISVDSATMMNKGLELIEAHFLFEQPEERIEILVHPQSVVHSMVAYCDGSVLAQLGTPDMRTPIANTLAWPDRMCVDVPRLDLASIARLEFEQPDPVRFPALELARAALKAGGSAPPVLNAANEAAVAAFLTERLDFLGIADVVAEVMDRHSPVPVVSIEEALELDRSARQIADEAIRRRAS